MASSTSLRLRSDFSSRCIVCRNYNCKNPRRFPVAQITPISFPDTAWLLVATALVLMMTDRKSTRLNSCHSSISYAVFCLKKKKKKKINKTRKKKKKKKKYNKRK